jgi:predicted nucleotide-binding protein
MKVFLSWSGERSLAVATALREWLPDVLQAVQPWLSATDIQAGARWASELELQLQESRVGIICLTPENVMAPWLLFEAGALSRSIGAAYVVPYLFGFSPSELRGPLVYFQAIQATHEGTWSLVHTLNRALGDDAIDETRLRRVFDLMWPGFEEQLGAARRIPAVEHTSQTEPASKQLDQALQKVIQGFSSRATAEEPPTSARAPRVFVIHGHNIAIRETVARFIERLGSAVIILNEQPSQGRTIIEKFESLSDVDYAVAIMSADDVGAAKSAAHSPMQSRARQNVVFELGFFAAKLGRSRIAVLYEEGIELPSDFSGIVYIPIDSPGAWKFVLARELKVAGLPIDLNNAL